MTDTYRLEMEIRKNGLTKKAVAQHLGLSEQGLWLKLTNRTEFKASEIAALCKLLNLEDTSIFFAEEVN